MDLSILAVGDIYLNRDDPEKAFYEVKPIFDDCDIVFGNLEAPLTNEESQYMLSQSFPRIKSDPKMVLGLVYANMDIVSLANNHAMDYGSKGLVETLNILKANNIRYIGAGRNSIEAENPVIIQRKGVKTAFVAFEATRLMYVGGTVKSVPGINKIRISSFFDKPYVDKHDIKKMTSQIRDASSKANLVVVSFHWGESSVETITTYQRALGHKAVDSGANVVVGHHPHVLQGVEVYKNGIICHSLGNFIFDLDAPEWREGACMAKFAISDKQIATISLIPTLIGREKIEVLEANEGIGKEIAMRLVFLSKELGTNLSVHRDGVYLNTLFDKKQVKRT